MRRHCAHILMLLGSRLRINCLWKWSKRDSPRAFWLEKIVTENCHFFALVSRFTASPLQRLSRGHAPQLHCHSITATLHVSLTCRNQRPLPQQRTPRLRPAPLARGRPKPPLLRPSSRVCQARNPSPVAVQRDPGPPPSPSTLYLSRIPSLHPPTKPTPLLKPKPPPLSGHRQHAPGRPSQTQTLLANPLASARRHSRFRL